MKSENFVKYKSKKTILLTIFSQAVIGLLMLVSFNSNAGSNFLQATTYHLQASVASAQIIEPLSTKIDSLKSQIRTKEKEIKQLEKKQKSLKRSISGAKKKQTTLKGQIGSIEDQMKNLDFNIRVTNLKVARTELEIKDLEQDIKVQEVEIRSRQSKIGKVLMRIYEYDRQSLLAVLLSKKSITDFFAQVEQMKNLEMRLQDKIDELRGLKFGFEWAKNQKEDKLGELSRLEGRLTAQRIISNNQKSQKKYLLQKTKNQEKAYQRMLANIEKQRQEINAEIFEIEDKLRFAIDRSSIPSPRSGVLAWPATSRYGAGKVSQGYGCTQFARTSKLYSRCFHNGIDIPNDVGTPVTAAQDGEVVALGNSDAYSRCYKRAYGKWIVVRHDNGLTTMYAHLSYQAALTGQKVKKGDVIGYMGSSGLSTGSHVHFTVYASKNFFTEQSRVCGVLPYGGTLNPFDYL